MLIAFQDFSLSMKCASLNVDQMKVYVIQRKNES